MPLVNDADLSLFSLLKCFERMIPGLGATLHCIPAIEILRDISTNVFRKHLFSSRVSELVVEY